MKYKVMIDGQPYNVYFSDVNDYYLKDENPSEDIIHYSIELNDGDSQGTIYAHIENPSQHTKYLISQGRCFITINCRNFIGHSGVGYHIARQWDSNDPRKTNPNWWGMSHLSGLGRGSYRFHKKWSLCTQKDSLLNSYHIIKVTDTTDIEIPIHFQLNTPPVYVFRNVKGFYKVEKFSDNYGEPYLENFYFDIRLALLTLCQRQTNWINESKIRVYQTKSKITRINFYR